jgi:hypothetical protein
MRLFVFCVAVLALPQAVVAQSAPVDSLGAFMAGGAQNWDVRAEPDMVAIALREDVARTRDDALAGQDAAADAGPVSEPVLARPAPRPPAIVAQASVTQTTASPPPVRQRTRAITPARTAPTGRTSRVFINPWQTGVFQ